MFTHAEDLPRQDWILGRYCSIMRLRAEMPRGVTSWRVTGLKYLVCTGSFSFGSYDINSLIDNRPSFITDGINARFNLACSYKLDSAKCYNTVL